MKRLLVVGVAAALSVACGHSSGGTTAGGNGGGNGGNAGGDNGGGSGGQYSQYDTLQGTFVAAGVNASFSGAMSGSEALGATDWQSSTTFDSGDAALPIVFTSPAGAGSQNPTLTITLELDAAPAAGTFTCTGSNSPTIEFGFGSMVWGATDGQGSCTLTLQTPTVVKAAGSSGGLYFAHGSLTAAMTGTLPDGGSIPGTMTATW